MFVEVVILYIHIYNRLHFAFAYYLQLHFSVETTDGWTAALTFPAVHQHDLNDKSLNSCTKLISSASVSSLTFTSETLSMLYSQT